MKVSKDFPAKYKGKCPICNQYWYPGKATLHYVDGVLQHAKCPLPGQVSQASFNSMRKQGASVQDIRDIEEDNALGDALAVAIADVETEERHEIKSFIPSQYQQAIFDFISNGSGHAVVEAVAGSGKTTTIVKALDLTPTTAKVAFVAFNKHIAQELKKRAPAHVHVSTLHSLGLSILRKYNSKIQIDDDKVGSLLEDIWPVSKEALKSGEITQSQRKVNFIKRMAMRKVVSICKSVLCDEKDANAVIATIERYGIEIDEDFTNEIIERLPEVMQKCKDNIGIVDFDDMIWLPLILEMKLEQFDFLMVDEAQDMNASQIKFILNSISPTGRIVAVGDRFQSLYGFRGADTNAIQNIIDALDATVLPLSVTYRCPLSHVKQAQELVPQLEAREGAPEGVIREMDFFDLAKTLEPGDMVICRTNAPLIKPAFECIRMGKKAMIRGKDIGASLINLIKRFETNDLGQFQISLAEYFEHEYTKLLDKGKEMQALLLQDRVETLNFICNECETVADLMSKIDLLFSDNNVGIVFSSVHRAKGLEAEKVFILRPDLMPHPKAKKDWEAQQEKNCVYVARTRSKNEIIYVKGGDNV